MKAVYKHSMHMLKVVINFLRVTTLPIVTVLHFSIYNHSHNTYASTTMPSPLMCLDLLPSSTVILNATYFMCIIIIYIQLLYNTCKTVYNQTGYKQVNN